MAEVTCPSPFSAAGSLGANVQVECVPHIEERIVFWNPSDRDPGIILSNGDLTADGDDGDYCAVRATLSKPSGRVYWECTLDGSQLNYHYIGIGTVSEDLDQYPGYTVEGYSLKVQSGGTRYLIHNNVATAYGTGGGIGDVIGIAFDLDNGEIWFFLNGTCLQSGDPATRANPAFTGISGTFFPMVGLYASTGTNLTTAKFSAIDQTYSPPLGFEAIDLGATDTFISASSLSSTPQPQISSSTFSVNGSFQAVPVQVVLTSAFSATAGFTCDHCFNYAQMIGSCPTPTSEMEAVFRYARLQAEIPVPTAGFRVGKRIEGECPVPGFTCEAYTGRNPSIIANCVVPTCSMRVGLSLMVEVGVPAPTCLMVADTHHLATLYGNVPTPTCGMVGDTENIAVISASAPCPRGLFTTTIGNVADIYGRVPVPTCSMCALTGTVVSLRGRIPVPGPLVRFYASLMNVSIALEGNVPVPTMTSHVHCSLPSFILKHIRGGVR